MLSDQEFNDYLECVKKSIRLVDTYEVPYAVRLDILSDIMKQFHKDVKKHRQRS